MTKIVIVPGINNSAPRHWQSWLESRVNAAVRIHLDDWQTPDLASWTKAVVLALDFLGEEAIIVAHGFGCLAAIRAIPRMPRRPRGALLVAPVDPVRFHFDPMTFRQPLGVRTVVVASEDDPWMGSWAARELSDALGADFLNLGRAGHINIEAGFGPWPVATRLIAGLERPLVRTFRPDFGGRPVFRKAQYAKERV